MFSTALLLALETNLLLKQEMFEESLTYFDPKLRKEWSEYYELRDTLRYSPLEFFEYMHVSVKVFDYILHSIGDKLPKFPDYEAEEILFITIRYMASGKSIRQLSHDFFTECRTLLHIIISTLRTIWRFLHGLHLRPPTPEEMPALAARFKERWNFPSCVGAIGAKYILTRKTTDEHEHNISKASIILTAVADANFRFQVIKVPAFNGNVSTFHEIYEKCGSTILPESNVETPYVIIGNRSFPLKTHLITPYLSARPAKTMHFNDKLKSARVPIEGAFEMLIEKWKVLGGPLPFDVNTISTIVRGGCLLYNIVRDVDGDDDLQFSTFGKVDKGTLNLCLVRRKANKGPKSNPAELVRDEFRDSFFRTSIDC